MTFANGVSRLTAIVTIMVAPTTVPNPLIAPNKNRSHRDGGLTHLAMLPRRTSHRSKRFSSIVLSNCDSSGEEVIDKDCKRVNVNRRGWASKRR